MHAQYFPTVLYKSSTVATRKYSEPLPPKNYVRIVAFAPDLRRAFSHGVIEFLHHRTTIKLLSLLMLMKGSYPSLRTSLSYWEVVISLVAAIARKFTQSCHSDWYLKPKRSPIPANANSPHNHRCVIYLEWLLDVWLCIVLASGPALALCDPTQPWHASG
jgi:hypothetical protein